MKFDEVLIKIGVDSTQAKTMTTLISAINNSANQLGQSAVSINRSLNSSFTSIEASITKVGTQSAQAVSVLQRVKKGIVSVAKAVSQVASVFDYSIKQTESLAKSKNALFKISEDEIALSQSYSKALDKSQIAISSVKNKIALGLAPTIVKLISHFNDWVTVNKVLIQNGINHLVSVLNKVIQVFVNTARFIDIVVSNTLGWQNALTLLGTAWAIFNRQLLFSPLGLVAAAIAGLMLLIDDFMVYMDGGDSLFGGFWGECAKWMNNIKSLWNGLSDEMKGGISTILSLLAGLTSVQFFMSVISGGIVFTSIIKSLVGSAKFLTNVLGLLSKAVLFLGRVFLMNPIGLIITLIAGLIYLLFDLYKWVTTGESTFGDFWQMLADGWNYVKDLFMQVIDWIILKWDEFIASCRAVCQSIGSIFTSVIDLISQPFIAAFDLIKALFGVGSNDATSYIDNLTKAFSNVADIITKPFNTAIAWIKDKFLGSISGTFNTVKGWFSKIGINFSQDEEADNDIADKFSAEQMSRSAKQAIPPSVVRTVNQGDINNNITIHSSDMKTSAEQVGNLFKKNLDDVSNNTVSATGSW